MQLENENKNNSPESFALCRDNRSTLTCFNNTYWALQLLSSNLICNKNSKIYTSPFTIYDNAKLQTVSHRTQSQKSMLIEIINLFFNWANLCCGAPNIPCQDTEKHPLLKIQARKCPRKSWLHSTQSRTMNNSKRLDCINNFVNQNLSPFVSHQHWVSVLTMTCPAQRNILILIVLIRENQPFCLPWISLSD